MTDHAKALADAARETLEKFSVLNGTDASGVPPLGLSRLRTTLAAYDAHPAEAATRENGDEAIRRQCSDMAFQSVLEKTGSVGCAAQVRDDVLTNSVAGGKRSLEHVAELYEKAKAIDAALSTHQQQGDRASTIEECATILDTHAAYAENRGGHSGEKYLAEALRILADTIRALPASRAPQPDTVTEEMFDMKSPFNSVTVKGKP